jgi:enoyl-CoA hydratase
MLAVWRCPKPTVAKVHGFCFAAGVQLAAACDLVVVTQDCRLGWPKLPLGGGFISPMLAWSIGPKRAKEMSLVVGSEFSGREAAEWGFANIAVPSGELDAAVAGVVGHLARRDAGALRETKARINGELERQGFAATVLAGGEWDAIAHEDPILEETFRSVRESGFRAAIAAFTDAPDQPGDR